MRGTLVVAACPRLSVASRVSHRATPSPALARLLCYAPGCWHMLTRATSVRAARLAHVRREKASRPPAVQPADDSDRGANVPDEDQDEPMPPQRALGRRTRARNRNLIRPASLRVVDSQVSVCFVCT